jgi:hypothetical protein
MPTDSPLPSISLENCVPSLRTALEAEPLDLKKVLRVALPIRDPGQGKLVPLLENRQLITITDGKQACGWHVESLTSLFRGDTQPAELGDVPEAYLDSLALLDIHALELSELIGDRRDEEMLEIYSALRRRPDGRSLGLPHDYMWQAAALVLGSRFLSKAEFEVIVGRLERSCRTFRMGPTSRNYVATLHQTLGKLKRIPPDQRAN